jgi:WD40 repeat protein/serine/threonine protein kinase
MNSTRTHGDHAAAADCDDALARVLDGYLRAIEAGDAPSPERLIAEHPAIADRLRACLASLRIVGQIGKSEVADRPADQSAESAELIGDYRVIRQIGRGGMGVVYEAEQVSLGRRVALKVLPFASALDHRQLQRFKIEAHAAALLHHTNIVPVFSVGSERGVHYFAMQYIEGRTLAAVIAELRAIAGKEPIKEPIGAAATVDPAAGSPPPDHGRYELGRPSSGSATSIGSNAKRPADRATTAAAAGSLSTDRSNRSPEFFRTVAQLGVQAAEALEHAHQNGIVHRDIKPANLLIDDRRNLWVTDFGLARFGEETGLTMSGDMLGTLRYMSPEQAMGRRCLIDHRTDIYSLAATMYELLTLQPVFDGQDRQDLLRQIAFDEPRPLARVNASVPVELETILHKALAKNPAERFDTAQEFADDLRRFLEDRPIRARRPSVVQRAAKFARRHRAAMQVLAGALVVLAIVSGIAAVTLWQALGREREQRLRADDALTKETDARTKLAQSHNTLTIEKQRTDAALVRERHTRYRHSISLADRELQANHVDRAERFLLDAPDEHRDWEWHYLVRQCRGEVQKLKHDFPVRGLAVSADGRLLASAGGTIAKTWSANTGEETNQFSGHTSMVWSVSLSPDGALAASASQDGTVCIWDTATGAIVRVLDAGMPVVDVQFNRDATRLVAACLDKVVTWDARSGEELAVIDGLQSAIRVAVSPDDQMLAISLGSIIELREFPGGRTLHRLPFHKYPVVDLTFSPDGAKLASAGGLDKHVVLWDTSTGRQLKALHAHEEMATCVAFSPDGKRLASGGKDRTVKVWDVNSAALVWSCRGNDGGVESLVWLPDGRHLVSGGNDGTIKTWDTGREVGTVKVVHSGPQVEGFEFDSDPERFISTSGAEVKVWRGGACEQTFALAGHETPVARIVFSLDGRLMASSDAQGVVKLWDRATRAELHHLASHAGLVFDLCFSHDGRWLVSGGADTKLRIWDTETGRAIHTLDGHSDAIRAVAINPDATRIASCGNDKTVRVWDRATGQELATFTGHTKSVLDVAFSNHRGEPGLLASAGGVDRTIRVWDLASGDELPRLEGSTDTVNTVSFTPNSRRIMSAGSDLQLRIWDAETGHELLGLPSYPTAVVFRHTSSPDGSRIAVTTGGGAVTVWDGSPVGKSN